MICPSCKSPVEEGAAFCSACGAELPADQVETAVGQTDLQVPQVELPPVPQVDSPPLPQVDLPPIPQIGQPSLRDGGAKPDGSPFSIELDTMLSLQEDVGNSLRILFTPSPSAGTFSDVSISLSSDDECFQSKTRQRRVLFSPCEFVFGVRDLKAGVCVCDVSVSFVLDGRRRFYDGSFDVVVLERRDSQDDAQKSLSFVFNPNIVASQASRVRVEVPEHAMNLLAQAAKDAERDPFKAAEELVNLGVRKYRRIAVLPSDEVEALPPPPPEAGCKEIQLDFGYGFGKVQFFTDPIIGIGHTYEGRRYTDIIVDPPAGLAGDQKQPYERMSRGQCLLRSNGPDVELVDGRIRTSGEQAKSTNGTYLNGERVGTEGCRLPQTGAIGLGTTCREATLDATLVTPSTEACQRCRRGGESRECCCRGGRACANVVLRRRDGVPIAYVALGSCIDMGCIHGRFSGLEIFYDRHAFAWRRGTKRGWLVPGGRIEGAHGRSIGVSPVWDESGSH